MPSRKTLSLRNSLWSCRRIGVWFMGENPRQGIPSVRRNRLSVPAGKISGSSWTPLERERKHWCTLDRTLNQTQVHIPWVYSQCMAIYSTTDTMANRLQCVCVCVCVFVCVHAWWLGELLSFTGSWEGLPPWVTRIHGSHWKLGVRLKEGERASLPRFLHPPLHHLHDGIMIIKRWKTHIHPWIWKLILQWFSVYMDVHPPCTHLVSSHWEQRCAAHHPEMRTSYSVTTLEYIPDIKHLAPGYMDTQEEHLPPALSHWGLWHLPIWGWHWTSTCVPRTTHPHSTISTCDYSILEIPIPQK